MFEFVKYDSTYREFRDISITEKIDGSNMGIHVNEDCTEVGAQSRNKLITPDDDLFGFAGWVYDNAGVLADVLGPGLHRGEYWGYRIQRGYGVEGRYFSLFNRNRFAGNEDLAKVDGLQVVPEIYRGMNDSAEIKFAAERLNEIGSMAAWNAEGVHYTRPEGVCIYHFAGDYVTKFTPNHKNDGHKGSGK